MWRRKPANSLQSYLTPRVGNFKNYEEREFINGGNSRAVKRRRAVNPEGIRCLMTWVEFKDEEDRRGSAVTSRHNWG